MTKYKRIRQEIIKIEKSFEIISDLYDDLSNEEKFFIGRMIFGMDSHDLGKRYVRALGDDVGVYGLLEYLKKLRDVDISIRVVNKEMKHGNKV